MAKKHGTPFEPGNKAGEGGARRGAGRPTDHLRNLCRKIVEKEKLIQFFADVAAGRIMDHKAVNGEVIKIPASLSDRREYAKELFDRAYGKATQTLANDPDNPIGSAVFILPAKEIGHKGGISK